MLKNKLVVVLGGSGFIGRNVVQQLAKSGYRVRVLTRDTIKASALQTSGEVGQISVEYADIMQRDALLEKSAGAYALVNLTGILFQSRRNRFDRIHTQIPTMVAQAARKNKIPRVVHISALGIDQASKNSLYARSKLAGESALFLDFSETTVLRPSIVFGPDDNFFNQFAAMSQIAPALPLIGGGKTLFQPVYVGDVARAVVATLENNTTTGRVYELGGASVLSFRELLRFINTTIHRRTCLLPVPFWAAHILAAGLGLLPKPPLTRDQVRLLKYNNVVGKNALTLKDLGITPTPMEVIVPHYLTRFRKR